MVRLSELNGEGGGLGRSRRRSISSVLTSWSWISSGSCWFICSRRFSFSPSIRSSSLTVTVATLERHQHQSCFVASSKHPRRMIVLLPVCLLSTLRGSKKRDTIISRRTHISRLSVSSKTRILSTWVGSEPSLSVLQPGVGLQS